MPGAIFTRVKVWVSAEDVTYSDLNAEFDNILNNFMPQKMDDYSATVSQMQTTADPGEAGSESLATTLAGELTRLRNMIREITGKTYWYESPSVSLSGLANAVGTGFIDNRIVSGRVVSSGTNEQPIFLVPNGAAATVSVKGSSTNFVFYVNGTEYTISSDVTLTNLTLAPSSNNTCLVDDGLAIDDEYTKYTGEDGSSIPVDNMETGISSLVGQWAAFKLSGAATEYFIAYVESTTALSKAYRGYFFDSADARSARSGYTDNDTITLMKLTWVFAKTDGTLTATYTNPTWGGDQPSSPAIGDYWYDTTVSKWKVYGVGSFSVAGATLVGVCIQDTSNCIGARSFEFYAGFDEKNTCELFYNSASTVKVRLPGASLNVWGNTIQNSFNAFTWDMTINLDSGITESASTYYFAYLTQVGKVVISDIKPYDRRNDLRGYYHPGKSWRCIGSFFNDGSSNIDVNSVNSYYSLAGGRDLKEASSALHIQVVDKVIRFTGNTASEYLPPAAKTRGQELTFIHAGTSLNQVYTLTTFTGDNFTQTGTSTYPLYTNGEVVKLYSDGANYIVVGHHAVSIGNTYAPTVGATTTPPTYGSGNTVNGAWSRIGSRMFIDHTYRHGTGGNAGSGAYTYPLPSNAIINTTTHPIFSVTPTNVNPGFGAARIGSGWASQTSLGSTDGVIPVMAAMVYSNASFYFATIEATSPKQGFAWGSGGQANYGSTNLHFTFQVEVTISGWQP